MVQNFFWCFFPLALFYCYYFIFYCFMSLPHFLSLFRISSPSGLTPLGTVGQLSLTEAINGSVCMYSFTINTWNCSKQLDSLRVFAATCGLYWSFQYQPVTVCYFSIILEVPFFGVFFFYIAYFYRCPFMTRKNSMYWKHSAITAIT